MKADYHSDYEKKHKREKDLDKFLKKTELIKAKNLSKEIQQYEKIMEVKLLQKRKRSDKNDEHVEEPADLEKGRHFNLNVERKPEQLEKINKEPSCEQEQFKYALEKIFKHLDKPAALTKCLNLIHKILISSQNISQPCLLKLILKLSSLPHKFDLKENIKSLQEIYRYIISINQDKVFSLFQITFEIQVKLITDDSFIFNSALKEAENKFLQIQDFSTEEKEEDEKVKGIIFRDENDIYLTSSLDEYIYKNNINLEYFKVAIERDLLFDVLRRAFEYHKYKWAVTSISSLFTKLLLERTKLSSEQFEELESMIGVIKNKSYKSNSLQNQRDLRDEKIKNTPLEAWHRVTDARSEVFVGSGLDKWGAKQMGLTSDKMFINN
jgi:hypothetical protein